MQGIEDIRPGQRWISQTEVELGLGMIDSVSQRHVRLRFPAVDEERVYARDNAPLSRVHFPIETQIRHQSGWILNVTGHREEAGQTVYIGTDADGQTVELRETELDSTLQLNLPEDRLFAGQIDPPGRFSLRQKSLQQARRLQQNSIYGLTGPRVQLLPHQFYIAYEVANRHAPRVLLADEVGLGKTIEAGLILHQQLIRGRAKRVLLLVPDSLVHQWWIEMWRRFNLHFSILDSAAWQEQPVRSTDTIGSLVLCSIDHLSAHPEHQDVLLDAEWDLLIVDEAHHLQWSVSEQNPAYSCVEKLSSRIPGLMLLTATPEQLGAASHFARLRLLDPARFHDLNAFVDEQKEYQHISMLAQQIHACADMNDLQRQPAVCRDLDAVLGTAWRNRPDGRDQLDGLLQSLLDRHGTGRVLFRNTRDVVKGFPARLWHAHVLTAPVVDSAPDATDPMVGLRPERIWGEDWLAHDPRVEWLINWLRQNREHKVLLICEAADTAIDLSQWVTRKAAIRCAVFHERLTLIERDRAAAYFAESDQGAQLLVCSEIGSEGRNFQFAQHLILFDLPLQPDLLEQRIGRLDRIGQCGTVHIHVPFYEGSVMAKLVHWYDQGLDAFQSICSVGTALMERFESELWAELQTPNFGQSFDSLLKRTSEARVRLVQALHDGRDRLLEMNSCRPEIANRILDQVRDLDESRDLPAYLNDLFDAYGVDLLPNSDASVVIKPTDEMLIHQFPGLPEEGMTATFSREQALRREDQVFLTWEHPMVIGAMDMVLNEGFGNATFCTLKLPSIAAGMLIVETVFDMHCPAPRQLELDRYLPPSCARYVLTSSGMNLSGVLTEAHIQSRSEGVKKRIAQSIIEQARPEILSLIKQSRALAQPWFEDSLAAAQAKLTQDRSYEIDRMQALSSVNPMIRPEELAHLNHLLDAGQQALQHASLRLDAIRVMVTT